MGPIAEGSDFVGSVRIPAAHCGIVGIKPTDGLVPTYPENFPFHPFPFLHGPLARTVDDAALMLGVMAGPDPRDPRTLLAGPTDLSPLESTPSGLRIGYLGGHPALGPVDPVVDRICRAATAVLASATGADVTEPTMAMPATADSEWALSLLNANRRAADLDPYLPERAGELDPHLVRRVESLIGKTAVDVARAEHLQGAVYHEFRRLFEQADILALPTVPTTAFEVGINSPEQIAGQPVTPLGLIRLTYVVNVTGHPAISIPAGRSDDDLPVGLQLVGRYHAEALLFALGRVLEQEQPWADRWPAI
jgi:Asp-tRNA(Asn)/Glu-tRNA(Gln) amidotransferase A subunit family amidase